jgi:hypothetical protein
VSYLYNMKFIITESKLENLVFSYLDSTLHKIDFYGEIYLMFKGTRKVVIKCDENYAKIAGHIIDHICGMFSFDYNTGYLYILKWIKSRISDKIKKFDLTPNLIYISDYITKSE